MRIGDELIVYKSVSEKKPWKLLGCERGAFNTRACAHQAGDVLAKLVSHGYGVFFPDIHLITENAGNLAESLNKSGVQYVSFDGLEGCMNTGHWQYGMELFTNTVLNNLEKKPLLCSSSRVSAFFWHMNTHQSWGEPKSEGFRTGSGHYWSKLTTRIKHLRANCIPFRLGYFDFRKIKHITDIEWVLTKGAGFDAGFDLINISVDEFKAKGQLSHDVMKAIRDWEEARMLNFFTDSQKEKFTEYNTVCRLKRIEKGKYELTDVTELATEMHQKAISGE